MRENTLLTEAMKIDPLLCCGRDFMTRDRVIEPGTISASFRAKEHLQRRYAWAIPNEEALTAIAQRSPIVEVGAGTGYWASLLSHRGADVIAYDIAPGKNNWCDGIYHPLLVGGPDCATHHPDRALFLCWPPYQDEMAEKALNVYTGNTLIYIGEYQGGCCATDEFFDCIEHDWSEIEEIQLPQWWGLHDACWIYQRK